MTGPAPTPSDRYQRMKALFAALHDRPSVEHSAILADACPDDPALRDEVLAMIAEEAAAAGFLEQPIALPVLGPDDLPGPDQDDDADLEGERIGAYRVQAALGRGGMGTVYLAVRDDDAYHGRVALKIVRRELASTEIARRFRQERQILARLEHEHIARLLDGGTTADGRPYLVMEYVEGQPIDRYCEARRLSTAERLRLFRDVCAAVQFAHQNLVVHRDLKPSNVLVNAAGVPKLLDFGIAKLLNPELGGDVALSTRRDVRLMTPEFASPEQARGEPVTTTSDIYSLGVLLYQLLTGRPPYELADQPLHEIARIICEAEPPRPSQVADPARGRELAGDIDTIVLEAMRKEPHRRYATVDQLSTDILRHLEGRPVSARPDTLSYRTGKFVRRHRGAVAAGLLVAISLVAGVALTTWQASVARAQRARAERRFTEVRQLANGFLFEFHDAIAALPGALPARRLVVARALQHLDGLAAEAADDASLQRELAHAYLRVGDIQGNPRNPNLGDADGARASYAKARAILDRLRGGPMDAQLAGLLAASTFKDADLQYFAREPVAAERGYRAALDLAARAVALAPGDVESVRIQYQARLRLGDLLVTFGKPDEATPLYEAAFPLAPRIAGARGPLRREVLDAGIHDRLAMIAAGKGDLTVAADRWGRGVALLDALLASGEIDAAATRARGVLLEKRAGMWARSGRTAEAAADFGAAVAGYDALIAADPANAATRNDLTRALTGLSGAEAKAGRPAEARAAALRAVAVGRQAADREGATALELNAIAVVLLAIEPAGARAPADALRYATRAVALTKGANFYFLSTLAQAQFESGHVADAVTSQEAVMRLLPAPPAGTPPTAAWQAEQAALERYRAGARRR